MEASAGLFCRLVRAWGPHDHAALSRLASPSLMAGWEPRLAASPGAELVVDGPVAFEYMGAANPAPGADRRAIIRVEGRLRPPSKQVTISAASATACSGSPG